MNAETARAREDSACGELIAVIDAVLPCIATKEDLEKLKSDLTWRIIIAMSILTAIFVAALQLRGS